MTAKGQISRPLTDSNQRAEQPALPTRVDQPPKEGVVSNASSTEGLAVALAVALILTLLAAPACANPRSRQPLVLTGAQLDPLVGAPTRFLEILSFQRKELRPIPFQVDEMLADEDRDPGHEPNSDKSKPTPLLTRDDETMMVSELGERESDASELPPGSLEVELADPLGGAKRYVYVAAVAAVAIAPLAVQSFKAEPAQSIAEVQSSSSITPGHYQRWSHSRPPASEALSESGFAPLGQTLFAPVLALAPPGPNRAARAIDAVNHTIPFLRRILFHPEFDPALEHVVGEMPLRQSTLIHAAVLYADPAIPWKHGSGDTRQIAVSGCQHAGDFVYSLARDYTESSGPFDFAGVFSLTPVQPWSPPRDSVPPAVIGRLAGDASLESFGAAALIDASAIGLKEIYGDLEGPWDVRHGEFNGHDRAALARLKQAAPKFSARLAHYFVIDNLLDEFSSAEGPFVLVNIDGRVRTEALKPYPYLYLFYSRFTSRVSIDSNIVDLDGNRWLHAQFDHGRIRLMFGMRDGMLVPLNAQLRPAGLPVSPNSITRAHWRSVTELTLHKFRTTFGLANIGFTTDYRRTGGRVVLTSHMDSVPQLVAPPAVSQMIRLIAGEFLSGLARGHGGMTISLTSERNARGIFHIAGGFTGELRYSPMLGMLARVGDTIADANNLNVRNDERRLGQELFDALVDDYTSARPDILILDTFPKTDLNP